MHNVKLNFIDPPIDMCQLEHWLFTTRRHVVATLLLEEWEDDFHTPEMGPWESVETPEALEFDFRGQNTSHWGVFYIIEKILKCRCRKWASMNHLDIWSTSYDKKKGWESNWQFDYRLLKVRNRPNASMWRWSVTQCWKALDEGYNFSLDLITIRGLHRKLCALKVARVPAIGISGLSLESPETKSHLDVAPVESCKVYYMGKVVASPESRPWWVLWVQSHPRLVLARRVLQKAN
jgi:hypothetical protein